MSSYKNTLQEYFQKKKEPLPKYHTVPLITDPPIFKSTLIIYDNVFEATDRRKKDAEQAVAALVLKELDHKECVVKLPVPLEHLCIMIDVENLHKVSLDLQNIENTTIWIIGQQDHQSYKLLKNTLIATHHSSNVKFTEVLFNRKDASDVVMCIELGRLIQQIEGFCIEQFILMSNDHFIFSLNDYINLHTSMRSTTANCVDGVIRSIKKFNEVS